MKLPDTIIGRFCELASWHPDRLSLIAGEKRYTYHDLACLSSAYANCLRESFSLAPGDILVAWLNNGPEFVASFLAAAASNAIFFPLNINLRPAELRWYLDRLPIRSVVTKQALLAPWEALSDRLPPSRIVTVDHLLTGTDWLATSGIDSLTQNMAQVSPSQPAIYFSSSGSTGAPKIVPRSHLNTIAGAEGTARALGLSDGLRFLSVVPFYHGNGFDNSLSLPLFSSCTLVLEPSFVPSRFSAALTGHQIQVLVGSPAIFELLVQFQMDAHCLDSLQLCASSGGPIAPQTSNEVRRRYGKAIRQVYGSTETGVMAIEPPDGSPAAVPVPHVSLSVNDAEGRSVPQGEEGEIAARGPAVVSGYVNDPELTRNAFFDGCFRTGDRGRLDSAGHLTILGRIRPVINLSGTKVDAVEIENVLRQLSDVVACRVFADDGPQQQQVIKAVIAVRENSTLTRAEVIAHCRQCLAEYKIPRIVEFVEALPPDLAGKRQVPWVRSEE